MNNQLTTLPAMSGSSHAPAAWPAQQASLLSFPGDARYARTRPWNQAVASAPRAVVHVQDAGDVAAAVRFAGRLGLRVAVRRTGHGAVPAGADVLLVHTAGLDECTVDPAGRRARLGAGVLWQQVIDAAAPHGLAPVCGSAPNIGVAGFLTGGGIGPLSRTLGAGSDHVRALEVVTGDGQLRRATPTENPDLFWGLRGGKATLGIVTAVEIGLVSLASFYGGCLWFGQADARPVLHGWQRLCEQLPEQASTSAAVMRLPALPGIPAPVAGRQTLAVRFAWTGDPLAGARQLDALRAVAAPVLDDVTVRPLAEIGRVHGDPTRPMPVHDRFALLHSLTGKAVDQLLAAVGERDNAQAIVELRLLGGAIARAPRHPAAFCHRDAAFTLFTSAAPGPDPAGAARHAQQVLAAMAPWTHGGLWANFAQSDDPDVIARCYDHDTLRRLTALGDQYDPARVLDYGQVARG
jgi:FAD/FMN-containing dehydrogenase